MIQLTTAELSALPENTKVYEGVGKMSVTLRLSLSVATHLGFRFVMGSTKDTKDKLSSQSKEIKSDISDLEKKLHYLETTSKNSRGHIEQLLRSGGRG